MAAFFTDAEIAGLIAKAKPLPSDWRKRVTLKQKRGHRERQVDLKGENGPLFRVILRQAVRNPLDFSVILALLVPNTNQVRSFASCDATAEAMSIRTDLKTRPSMTFISIALRNGIKERVILRTGTPK